MRKQVEKMLERRASTNRSESRRERARAEDGVGVSWKCKSKSSKSGQEAPSWMMEESFRRLSDARMTFEGRVLYEKAGATFVAACTKHEQVC